MMKKVLIYTFLATALFVACEGPVGSPGPAGEDGEDGAWVIIDAIELTSDTEIVTFDGISEDWDFLELRISIEIHSTDSLFDGEMIYMRVNSDSLDNYINYLSGSITDKFFLFEYAGWERWTVQLETNHSSGYDEMMSECGEASRFGRHLNDAGIPISRLDIFNSDDERLLYARGSKFILLGLDID